MRMHVVLLTVPEDELVLIPVPRQELYSGIQYVLRMRKRPAWGFIINMIIKTIYINPKIMY